MFKCDDCDQSFAREGNLRNHASKVHGGGVATADDPVAPTNGRAHGTAAKKKASRAKRGPDAPECELCEEAAVARLCVPDVLDWPLCEDHLKVTIRFVEPLE